MLAWHQATGNNIETAEGVTPNYNQKCGWAEGAQKDIFENNGVQEAVARPHPWSVDSSSDAFDAKVARPHPWRVSSSSDEIDTKVARPHPWSVENNSADTKVARPHPWRMNSSSDAVEAKVARPQPWSVKDDVVEPKVAWSVNASSVIVPSGAASSSTLAAHVITLVITPTSAQDAVSATSVPALPTEEVSCSARRPRYTPNVRHR
jgi:hypothetical protein